jgi:hypothetical protein
MVTYTAWGFDFAYGNGITVAELQAQGCQFVCRYLSGTPGSGKDIAAQEIKNYKAGGIAIVLNWETSGQETSQAQGVSDAQAAQAELNTLASQSGFSEIASAPVIFSCDTDPNSTVEADAVAYMRGVNSVLGLGRSGGYGGYGTIQALFNAGVITYGWQTYAWSDGEWDSRAQLQQWNNDYTVGPASVDQDRATADNYGQVQWVAPKPTLPAPDPASNTPYTLVDLGWTAVTGASNGYSMQIANSSKATTVFRTTTTSTSEEAVRLPSFGTYYWRVAAQATSSDAASPWSGWAEINASSAPAAVTADASGQAADASGQVQPAAAEPTLGVPDPVSNTPYALVDLGWTGIAGASNGYSVQIANSSKATTVYSTNTTATSLAAVRLPSFGTFYWRLAAHATSSENSSPWSGWAEINAS